MKRNILIVGAGRSASSMIKYLLDKSEQEHLHLTIGDISLISAQKKALNHTNATPIVFDIFEDKVRAKEVSKSDIVISMLPANLHLILAKECLLQKKHLVTASYISPQMKELDTEVRNAKLIFMNEVGLDPGIDHMSAMRMINDIKEKGGKIKSFESYCGGLIAPESDNNYWNYKFTWNPRNVVVAGQGTAAKYLKEGQFKLIPYTQLFRRAERLTINNHEDYEVYANRDSLKYQNDYGLQDASTIIRGTIRRLGYSRAWSLFVDLGLTDDSYTIDNSKNLTYKDFIDLFLPFHPTDSIEAKFKLALHIAPHDSVWLKIQELDLFNSTKKVNIQNATPAQILEKILNEKWALEPQDKDMIIMYHRIKYTLKNKNKQINATMACIGDNQTYTAMAKTVGLPVAIATLMILNKQINKPGVQLPITKDIYLPILEELHQNNISFTEEEQDI
ncbi:saccharopine dehydrogenase C-terminal domain-containing protein [Myroides pelagicus]|uniref:Saccharopine dehydrogenase n=1 Tax=Myroides pelagicus TaxID=270914 RepID=A0A7K1GJF6_9FLAO|nr:saccharopine dehydrogenase C-terminal domain-containing protein [Myroides pelagicus]MEC4113051.1 saccharopine dehydrogenase C-terminal domain-containing protein [Myroides pelagicus]MTH28946.1 saccharopine dehydrogenase [Myroides pelagicus]